MGISALAAAANLFPPTISNLPGGGAVPVLHPQYPTPQRDVAALHHTNPEQALTEAFEGAVYRSLESHQSLRLQHNALQGQLGQGGDGQNTQIGFQATQLQFDFFSETRYEELALFSRRTAAIGEGLQGPQRSSFYAASREISVRFELSVSISGAALDGFAHTAEGAGEASELIDRLLEVARKLLEQADALFNGFFSQLSGGDGAYSAASLNELFNEFVSGFINTLSAGFQLPQGLSGVSPVANGTSNTAGARASVTQLEFNFQFSASIASTEVVVQQGDPIVLDLDGDGIELTSYQQGARFDLIGSGRAQQVAFVHGGDAFLALDRNGDGIINSGRELFGEQHGARNGYEELRRFDHNRDGVIDRNDAIFNELLLFRDNGNGITEPGELLTLQEAGIAAIQLDYREVDEAAAGGNRLTQIGAYLRNDGTRGTAADALLNYIA